MEIISSRTPEGQPNSCPVCGRRVVIEPSKPPGEAPCPHCGHLLWFDSIPMTVIRISDQQDWESFSTEMIQTAQELVAPFICLDLQDIQSGASGLIGKLLLVRNRVHEFGGAVKLINVSPHLQNVIELMKLDSILIDDDDEPTSQDFTD